VAAFKRTEIPRGLSAAQAQRLISPGEVPVPLNGKALRGSVLATVGLLCVLALPLAPRIAVALRVDPNAAESGPAGAFARSPFLEMTVVAVALTGLLVAALAIVDGVFGWMEIRTGRSRGTGLAAAAVAIGVCALSVFFLAFYFPG
jgi:hypothetical protein